LSFQFLFRVLQFPPQRQDALERSGGAVGLAFDAREKRDLYLGVGVGH